MSFSEIFKEARELRNIKPREFGIYNASNYLATIEKNGVLPRPDKRDILISCIGAIAAEQGADREEEEKILLSAWWQDTLKRTGLTPDLASSVARLVTASEEHQAAALQAIDQITSPQTEV